MELLTANQLYNASGAEQQGVKFKDWLQNEQEQHKMKVEMGKITGKMPFLQWLNLKIMGRDKFNAEGEKSGFLSGEFGQALKNVVVSAAEKVAGKTTGTATTSQASQSTIPIVAEKRILGMKPGVAIAVGVVVALTATVVTIKLIKRAKAK